MKEYNENPSEEINMNNELEVSIKKAEDLILRADILLTESSITLITDGFNPELITDWCRVYFLTFQCPKCRKLHSFDLRRVDLLEVINQENWTSVGIMRNSCGKFSISIRGKILIKIDNKKKIIETPKF